MKIKNISTLILNLLSKEQFKREKESGLIDENSFYLVPDDAKNTWYGTCDSESYVGEKVVTTTTGDFKLETGNFIFVKFTNVNATYEVQLNVDGLGAVGAYRGGVANTLQNLASGEWNFNDTVGFVVNAERKFERIEAITATTLVRGAVKLDDDVNSTSTTTAATPNSVKKAYDLAKETDEAVTELSEAIVKLDDSKSDAIVETAIGEVLALTDAADAPIRGLVVYGKSAQDGTPTPDAPVPIVSVGEDGDITLTIEGGENDAIQTIPIATPAGLCGIPVTSGGNYTDANGQQWVCDEVNFERGVRVQRINRYTITGTEDTVLNGSTVRIIPDTKIDYEYTKSIKIYCNRFVDYSQGFSSLANAEQYLTSGEIAHYYQSNTTNAKTRVFFLKNAAFTSVDAAKSWLATNPTEISVILNTAVETPLTEDEIEAYRAAALRTNYPNTTIYADDNAGLSVDYKADTKLYIDKKFAELAAAIVNA